MSRLGRLAKIHEWPGWTASAAIIGGLALIVAVLAWWLPQSPGSDTAASSGSPTSTSTPTPTSTPSTAAPGPSTSDSRAGGNTTWLGAISRVREDIVTMGYGDSLNMETGEVGKVVDKPDITYVSTMDKLVSLQGGIAAIRIEVTAPNCIEALEGAPPSTTDTLSGGDWFCVRTSAQHVAAVAVLSRADSSTPGRLHYVVWRVQKAPF